MFNDFIMWVVNIIDYFASFLLALLNDISALVEQGAYFIQQFNVFMSYVYFFIPSFHLSLILGAVVAYTLVRVIMAIVNIVWP